MKEMSIENHLPGEIVITGPSKIAELIPISKRVTKIEETPDDWRVCRQK
jgi:hypothetical protein